MTNENNQKDWQSAGKGKFYPFISLQVGQKLQGVILDRREVSKDIEKKGKKVGTETKIYYDIRLTEKAVGYVGSLLKKTAKDVSFEVGDCVTLQNKGNLDSQLLNVAKKIKGQEDDPEAVADPGVLVDGQVEVMVERKEDGIMNKGEFKGRPCQNYDVKFR